MTDHNNTNKPNDDGMHISKVLTYAVVLKPNAERKDEQAPRPDVRPSADQGS